MLPLLIIYINFAKTAGPGDENGCFLIRFRWSSVDRRKRCKNASVDGKLFIRFQETENGGFRKRISEDRASCKQCPRRLTVDTLLE